MSQVLVLVEAPDGAVRKPTLELLTLARRIGEPAAVVLGPGADQLAARLGEYGASTVCWPARRRRSRTSPPRRAQRPSW